MVSASAIQMAPGETTYLKVNLSANVALFSSVELSSAMENNAAAPSGLSAVFDPPVLTLSPNVGADSELRVTTAPVAMDGTYSVIITARSDSYSQSARLKITLSGAGRGWVRQIGTPGTEVLSALAVDSTGSLYAGGQTTGDMGGHTNAGQFDGFVLKYQPSGALLWAQTLATASTDVVTAMAVDAADNVYVAGYTYGAFPGHMPAGTADGFVAKYTANGTQVWLQQLGTSEIDQLTAVAADPTGGVVVIGTTEGGFGTFSNKGQIGTADVVVFKFTADGHQVFVQQLGTDQNERPAGVAVDAAGGIYVVGSTQGTFGGQTSIGGYDVFLCKLQADGKLAWLHQAGTPYDDHLAAALIDSKGSLIAAGWTRGSYTGQVQTGGQDALLLYYGPDGSSQRSTQFGTSYNDVLGGIALVGDTLYSIGSTRGDFPDQIPAGASDVFVVRHAADGTVDWLTQVGTDQNDYGNAVAATADALYLGGTTFGAFDTQTLQGDSDGFVIQFLGAAAAQGY